MVLPAGDDQGDYGIRAIRNAALRGAASARDRDDAEDAAQDAIAEMIASKTTFTDPVAIAKRLGRFRAIDGGRRAARRREAERAQFTSESETTASPENEVVARLYLIAVLQIARSRLTPAEFEGLKRLYCDGGTISDAARVLATQTGCSFESVRTQIRRAVQKMRDAGGDP